MKISVRREAAEHLDQQKVGWGEGAQQGGEASGVDKLIIPPVILLLVHREKKPRPDRPDSMLCSARAALQRRAAADGGGDFKAEPEVEASGIHVGIGLPSRRRPQKGGLLGPPRASHGLPAARAARQMLFTHDVPGHQSSSGDRIGKGDLNGGVNFDVISSPSRLFLRRP